MSNPNLAVIPAVLCGFLLFPAETAVGVDAVSPVGGSEPLVALWAGDAGSPVAAADASSLGRVDNELTETYGTCVLTDFRHHSLLTAEAWDVVSWQSVGFLYACNDENYRNTFGPRYQMKLELLVDGRPEVIVPEVVTQQLDCRTTAGQSASLQFHRLDMMLASLQWTTAYQCRNKTGRPVQLECRVTLSDSRNLPKPLAASSDHHVVIADSFVPCLVAFDRKPEVATQGATVVMSWKQTVAPQQESSVCLALRPGWGDASVDKERSKWMNYNLCTKLDPPELLHRQETEFRSAARLLGQPDALLNWKDLGALAAAKQQHWRQMLPRLTGMPPAWAGLWAYTFDLLRAGTKPPQGLCTDLWMAGDLHFYLWTFYWDTALSAHAYCQADADAASRILLNFLKTGIRPDGSTWLQFNPVQRFPNDRPQLLNIPMALWDAYQVTRDQTRIAEAYPILERHQHWLDQVWNKRPNGPIADLDWNIDYGCDLHKERHLWLDMTTFQVSQYDYLARMARLLGKDTATIAEWESKAAQLKKAINRFMWNEKDGAYYCLKSRNLKQTKVSCPIEFYTLTTGVASPQQARRLVKRLLDPDKYAPGKRGKFFCPSVSYDDPSFKVVPEGSGGWGGNLWLVEPYYTVRGLARYGLQHEAALVTSNLYAMVASEYLRTGSLWEQYDPTTGRGIHLKYFTSGIASTIVDMLLRGLFGFERTDDPFAFYLTPHPVQQDWHGIENLVLSRNLKLAIQIRGLGNSAACKVTLANPPTPGAHIQILQNGKPCQLLRLNPRNEAETTLALSNGGRYLWRIVTP